MADLTSVELPSVFTRRQALALGLSDRQLDRGLTTGALVAVRRGVLRRSDSQAGSTAFGSTELTSRPVPEPALVLTAESLPLDLRAALLASPQRRLVISRAGAARLWGLPRPIGGWPGPQFTATDGPSRNRRGVNVKVAPLGEGQVVEQDGLSVTSPSRTVADCLRSLPGRDGLAIADDALNRGLATTEEIVCVLRGQSGWPGVGLARQVLALADGRRESPLESWSAWAFAHIQVPLPGWQVEIRSQDGLRLARVDCWWRSGAVVGEADGRVKYALAAAERGGNAEALLDVLQAERRREQRLREAGVEVVRWSTKDVIQEPAARALAGRILAAIALGQERDCFTGVVAPALLPPATAHKIN